MKALFAGSFDPFTLGHLDIVKKTLKEYDELIICISNNEAKKHLFSQEDRKRIIEAALADLQTSKKITIVCNSGTTVDVAIKYNVDTLIRGIRSQSELDNEVSFASINEKLAQIRGFSIKTKLIWQEDFTLKSTSSSLVRALFSLNEYIVCSHYVPKNVHQELLCIYLKPYFKGLFAEAYVPRVETLWADLVKTYKSRPYHNLSHLGYMINMLNIFQKQASSSELASINSFNIILAIFMHDYVYDVTQNDNEERSIEETKKNWDGITFYQPKEVLRNLILATKHTNVEPLTGEPGLVADLDLAILGTNHPQTWDDYCNSIRQEYSIYSDKEYALARTEFLVKMLKRKQIFNTDCFFKLFEKQARKNIRKEIFKLRRLL